VNTTAIALEYARELSLGHEDPDGWIRVAEQELGLRVITKDRDAGPYLVPPSEPTGLERAVEAA